MDMNNYENKGGHNDTPPTSPRPEPPKGQSDNLLVWQQTIYQKPDGTIDIQMAIDPEFQKHMQQKHFGLIEAFVKQIIGDVIYSMKNKLQSDKPTLYSPNGGKLDNGGEPLIKVAKGI